MFRKKDSETELPAGAEGAFRRSGTEGAGKAAGQPELPRRKVDLPASSGGQQSAGAAAAGTAEPVQASAPDRPDSDAYSGKRLIVGEGIRLSGEISSCDRLIVEGAVEVTLNDTLALEIAQSGRFTGGCEVEEADISGIYEGDLTVRNRLVVRGSGKLTGTVRYGELELERGGQIAGNISVLNSEGDRSVGAASATGGRAPLFGGGERADDRRGDEGDDGE
ncbi:MAG: polymer-forming cytoskeletal protein [Geminicoccaceae bacterium]|nr:polymer-forming cytoskeletal protein [Geminicoccaceae bacterium]